MGGCGTGCHADEAHAHTIFFTPYQATLDGMDSGSPGFLERKRAPFDVEARRWTALNAGEWRFRRRSSAGPSCGEKSWPSNQNEGDDRPLGLSNPGSIATLFFHGDTFWRSTIQISRLSRWSSFDGSGRACAKRTSPHRPGESPQFTDVSRKLWRTARKLSTGTMMQKMGDGGRGWIRVPTRRRSFCLNHTHLRPSSSSEGVHPCFLLMG